jgi:hypothetical protein
MRQPLFTNHDKYHLHKLLGFGCLFNYLLRIYWLIIYGTMSLSADNWITSVIPVVHLTLSMSSFIFQVPKMRFSSKIIIWKELQLHNIVFTMRSAIIMIYSIICIQSDITINSPHYHSYQIGKFALIVVHHILADYITAKYNVNEKTTTRDINWENIPDNIKIIIKKYYAFCQILAINALLLTENDRSGSGAVEAAFLVMFPIQLSTFLMTLVRKSIISNISWHVFYALSLLSPFFIIINTINSKNGLEVSKVYLPILYIVFRLQYNMNKYYLMFHVFSINMYIQYMNGISNRMIRPLIQP